ncbi:MAG: hypothetical protein NT154_02290 [Verrucomicrobia bacterium]|nr:hypothetical protein [Verrucomicrobiota bacterium]
MHKKACNNSTGPSPLMDGGPYPTPSAAVAALTTQDQSWLSRLAARRLRRLRTHAGLARYLAGKEPAELVDEAIQRLQSGSRRTKPKHLASHQAFLNHIQSVINSIANNYTRHAEPHVEHLPVGMDKNNDFIYVEPPAAQNVRRDVTEREWLYWLFAVLEHSVSLELQAELARLREAGRPGMPADQLVQQCSERLLNELRNHVQSGGTPGFQMAN